MIPRTRWIAGLFLVCFLGLAHPLAVGADETPQKSAAPASGTSVTLEGGATVTVLSFQRPCRREGFPFFPIVEPSQEAVAVKARIRGQLPKDMKTWLEDEHGDTAKAAIQEASGQSVTWVYVVQRNAQRLTLHFSSGESLSLAKWSKKRK